MTMLKGPSGVRADRGYSYRKLEVFAASVRERLSVPQEQAIDPLQVFEELHEISILRSNGKELPLRGGVVALEDSEGYARYSHECDILEILASEETYEWLEQRHPRACYFVAHELGHCLLHTDQLVRLAQMPVAQQAAFHRGWQVTAHGIYRDTEWQANAFASALLMPARGLLALEQKRGGLCPTAIADHFHVSAEAASYRLELYKKRKRQLV